MPNGNYDFSNVMQDSYVREAPTPYIIEPSRRNEKFLTPQQVAQRLGIPVESILHWTAQGWLDSIQNGTQVLIPADTLDGFSDLLELELALNQDRPPATNAEMMDVLEPERIDWTWHGKAD